MPGSALRYRVKRYAVLDIGWFAVPRLQAATRSPLPYGTAICLRVCYAMSSTEITYSTAILCMRYAMSGTDLLYGGMALCDCSAMCGTAIGDTM
eukprot:3940254-Rhodomonas_salina.5